MRGKKGYIVGTSIIILLFGLWAIKNFKYRYNSDKLVTPDKLTGLKNNPKSEDTSSDFPEVGYILINGERAKAPHFKFIDQNSDTITQKDYKGKVYVVEFFYTTCPTICPIMSQNLVEVSHEFKGNDKFGIASFSIDPSYDSPEILKEYAEKYNITNPNWHLMTGKRDSLYALAEKGFMLNAMEDPNEPGGILHSGMFVLIDQEGYIRSRQDQYGNPIIYYRGFIKRGTTSATTHETPQINALIQDIKTLLHH